MRTIATKVNNDVYNQLINECNRRGITKSEKIRELIQNQGKPIQSHSYEETFEHMNNCNHCRNAIVDKGYVLVSVEELKKHKLVPARLPS